MEYRVSALREQIHAQHADRVAKAKAAHAQEVDLEGRRLAWRAEQERRVRSLASQLRKGNVSDAVLAAFEVKSPPSRGFRDPDTTLANALEDADAKRDRALRRLDAVRSYTPAGETEPVLSLTATMLADWFSL